MEESKNIKSGRTIWNLLASWGPDDIIPLVFISMIGLAFIVMMVLAFIFALTRGVQSCP